VLKEAAAHNGAAFVEVWQNCVIFNDGAYKSWTERAVRDDQTINLMAGQKMIFGKDQDKGLRLVGLNYEVCSPDEADVWDPAYESSAQAYLLTQLDEDPALPRPMGVMRAVVRPTLDQEIHDQVNAVTEKKGEGSLKDLLYTPDCWVVE